jgi:hypothetical protein
MDLTDAEGAKISNVNRMSGRSCGFRRLKAGFRWRKYHRHLPRAFETECDPLNRKYAASALAYTASTTQRLLAEF